MKKDLGRCQTVVKYWKMFCSCSYPGRGPGPGPGPQQFPPRRAPYRRTPSRQTHLDSHLLWIYLLAITWCTTTIRIVGCKDDELLVSSCDFSKLERLAAAAADADAATISIDDDTSLNDITPAIADRKCNYTKLNYYDYLRNDNNNNNNKENSNFNKKQQPGRKDEEQSKKINTLRLEAIKHQILAKLGLKSKPNITHTLSKEFVMETLRRAGETRLYSDYDYHQNPHEMYYIGADHPNTLGQPNYKVTNQYYQSQQFNLYSQPEEAKYHSFNENADELMAADDYYGHTREILAFAHKGKLLNGQRLLEFSITPDDRSGMNQELRVRMATLWINVDLRQGAGKFRRKNRQPELKSPTLWIFRLVEPFETYGGGYLNEKDFDRATDLIAVHYIDLSELGWRKVDLTSALRKWYSDGGGSKKLRLLIDCSGCGDRVEVHLFNPPQQQQQQQNKNNKNIKSNHHQHHHHHNHLNNNNKNNNNIYYHDNANNNINTKNTNNLNKNNNNNNNQFTHSRVDALKDHHSKSGDHYHLYSASSSSSSAAAAAVSQDNSQINDETGSGEINRPYLVVRLDPYRIKRVRRRALDCSGALKGQCCKQRFYVSFKELGWDDWILAPPGYEANYCRGDCAGLYRTPDLFGSMHTHFIEEYRKSDKLDGMQPCCAPTKFSSMSIIYYGPDEKIIKQDLPKMVVDECGCP